MVGIYNRLPLVTEEQIQYGLDHSFDSYHVIHRKTTFCLDCGHQWKPGLVQDWQNQVLSTDCPNCNAKSKNATRHYNGYYSRLDYYAVIDTIENHQVVRIFLIEKSMKKKEKASYRSNLVLVHFMDENAKLTTFAKSRGGNFSHSNDGWVLSSDITIKINTFITKTVSYYGNNYNVKPYKVWPKVKILPIIKRNGFKKTFYSYSPQELFYSLLTQPKLETLIKAKQNSFVNFYLSKKRKIESYWNVIKVCMRNNYVVKDATMYLDYLDFLSKEKKDLSNPKFVCPKDLKKEHNIFMKLINEKRNRERNAENLKEKLRKEKIGKFLKNPKLYVKEKGKFFDLNFTDGNLVVVPMKSVSQFYEEGQLLDHCVHTNGYFAFDDSLILSARIDGVVTETVEVVLSTMTVTQCRGFDNEPTKHNQQIIDLVNENLREIQKCMRVKKSKPTLKKAA